MRGLCLPVIGVDMSANSTGVVVLGSNCDVRYAGTICPGRTGAARLFAIHAALTEIVLEHGPFSVSMREDYALGATNKPYLMGEVGGIAQVVLYPHTNELYECAPKALKKFMTGNASASKREMMDAARDRHGFRTDSDDVADAYALARVAACLSGYIKPTDRPALEVLAVLRGKSAPAPKKAPSARRPKSVSAFEIDG